MKCDDCRNHVGEMASLDYPYPSEWCAAGHWDGIGPESEPEPGDDDPYGDCKDYEQITPESPRL